MSQKRASSVCRAERLVLVLLAEILDLVVVGGPLLALERDRRLRPELRRARERERLDVRPRRGDRDRRRHIDAGFGLVPVRIRRICAVIGARLQDLCGDRLAELDPRRLRVTVGNRGEIGRHGALQVRFLRIEANQDGAGRRGGGGLLRRRRSGRKLNQIGPIAAFDRIDCVEHRDLDDRDDPLAGRGHHPRCHECDGLLVPVGDHVGESRWCRPDHGDSEQHLAKIGVHVALLWLSAIHVCGLLP